MWRRGIIYLISWLSLAFTVSLFPTPALAAAEYWYEDGNLGQVGGYPPDLITQFQNPLRWPETQRQVHYYILRTAVLNKPDIMSDAFLKNHLFPTLRQNQIKFVLDTTSITLARCRNPAGLSAGITQDIALIERLQTLGGEVSAISLQSVLSFKFNVDIPGCHTYPVTDRIHDIVTYIQALKAKFPQIKIGLIDSMPTQNFDYKPAYTQLVQAANQAKVTLDYLHLDMPYEHGTTDQWQRAKTVAAHVRNLGVRFGLIYTHTDATSNQNFATAVMKQFQEVFDQGIRPSDYVIMSWGQFPTRNLPETGEAPTYLRTVLDLGKKLTEHQLIAGKTSVSPDLNRDGKVNIFDYNLLLTYFSRPTEGSQVADLNHDGRIDVLDYNAFLPHYQP